MKLTIGKPARRVTASTDKDYARLQGMQFDKAKAILEKDGFVEHEYGDTKDGNGYDVFRKGKQEVELTYEWIQVDRRGKTNHYKSGKVLDVYVDDDIYTPFTASCDMKSVKASTSGKIPYDLVSMLIILRDWISLDDEAYLNSEHKDLVDMADGMYNGSLTIDDMRPEYRSTYDKYGADYFDKVLEDASALDSQVSSHNVNDLIADFNDRCEAFE